MPAHSAAVDSGVRVWRRKNAVYLAILAVVLLAGSGQPFWLAAWIFLLILTLSIVIMERLLVRVSPDLLAERSKLQAGTKKWDVWLSTLVALVLPLLMLLTAALDRRHGWSAPVPRWLETAGFAGVAAGAAVMTWAMVANRYFASTVRIQHDRGQRVVSSGPYGVVRHPGYAGSLLYLLATPAALGSKWAWIAAGVCAVVTFVRTALEDGTLQQELGGYKEYAARVRYRLVPGLW